MNGSYSGRASGVAVRVGKTERVQPVAQTDHNRRDGTGRDGTGLDGTVGRRHGRWAAGAVVGRPNGPEAAASEGGAEACVRAHFSVLLFGLSRPCSGSLLRTVGEAVRHFVLAAMVEVIAMVVVSGGVQTDGQAYKTAALPSHSPAAARTVGVV